MTISKAVDDLRSFWRWKEWCLDVQVVDDLIEVTVSSLVKAEHAFAPYKYKGYAVRYVRAKEPTR